MSQGIGNDSMKMVTITIDGKNYMVPEGEKLLWAALEQGIFIPHLCAMKEEKRPSASCRLCFVEIEGYPNPVTSCTTLVKAGMIVKTRSEWVDRLVRTAFELILSNHRLGCAKCAKNKKCELQKIARERGLKLKLERLNSLVKEVPPDDSAETFTFDPTRCVLCGKCVWADRKQETGGAIGFVGRGMSRRVSTFGGAKLAESCCTQCGACVDSCPTGALAHKS